MKYSTQWHFYREAWIRLWYPAYCGGCGTFLKLEEDHVCGMCQMRLEKLRYAPEEAVLDEKFHAVDEAWGLYEYDTPVKEIIAGIKFYKKIWPIHAFHERIRELATMIACENHYDAVVPIPISRLTRIHREFNQAVLIAHEILKTTGLPVKKNILRKRPHAVAQSHLTQKERWINPWGIFEPDRRENICGRSFLLTDDIITTGATAEEAARILKQQGAKRVDLFALARTPRAL